MTVKILKVVALFFLSSCVMPDQRTYVPAILINSQPKAIKIIEDIISTSLHGTKITLSKNAFIHDSIIIIEPTKIQSIEQPQGMGRNVRQPEKYQLILDGGQCFLLHDKTQLTWHLGNLKCGEKK